jgi:hypothetical protein
VGEVALRTTLTAIALDKVLANSGFEFEVQAGISALAFSDGCRGSRIRLRLDFGGSIGNLSFLFINSYRPFASQFFGSVPSPCMLGESASRNWEIEIILFESGHTSTLLLPFNFFLFLLLHRYP